MIRRAPSEFGDLKDAISISTKQRKGLRKKSRIEIFVGVNTGHGQVALQQEFGNVHSSAQPFLRPALDTHAYTTLNRFGEFMWDDIEKTAKRAARKAAKRVK